LTHSLVRFVRTVVVSKPCLTFAALLLGVLAPRAASAVVQGAELYRTQAYFYGRFEARVRFAPGEGVVSSFFLWKDGSSSTTTWNELDFEKINSDCRLQTNIWTAQGTQSAMINTPSFNICNDYHTYAFEWTPDYIAWFIDGSQIRKVTGASVTEYTKNSSAGMAMHFNIWQGDSSFGGNLSTSTLPVYEYISWAQYSSYANNAFTLQWREEFTGSTTPANWALGNWLAPLNHSMHNPANAKFVNGIAVLALTNDNATGYSGTPPADPASGGTTGTGGAGGTTGSAGTSGTAGTGGGGAGAGGGAGRGGAGASGSPGSGGTTSTGAAGNGAAGTTGTGGRSTGTAGTTGAAGTTGTAGTTGAAGTTGTAGTTGEAGTSGSGGTVGTGGTSDTGAAGTTGTGGTSSGGAGSTGSGEGCGCRAAGDGLTGSGVLITVLLIAGLALRRRPRRAQSL
jgi:hypothetical protein